jgi:hypothetical protein
MHGHYRSHRRASHPDQGIAALFVWMTGRGNVPVFQCAQLSSFFPGPAQGH